MNTLAVIMGLIVMVTVASGLGYNNFNTYPSVHGNAWGSLGSTGGFLNGGWNHGRRGSLRYKRAAVGYGPYDPYRGGVLGNLGGNFGGRFGGRLGGWRNSGLGSLNGY